MCAIITKIFEKGIFPDNMSRFLNSKFNSITPYDTSEEIESMKGYIRLNTNESPFELEEAKGLNFYCDPECTELAKKLSELLNVKKSEIVFGNGSDEILNFLFMAFCENGAVFPDITYSFYKILAAFHGVNYIEIPLRDFRIYPDDYKNLNGRTIFIANPNAPTGIALNLDEIEKIIKLNPESLVVIDEAYIDFGGESSKNFIQEYNNVVVTRTFSKSRSMAGARLGFSISCEEISNDIRKIKNTITPYNINAMTQDVQKNIRKICEVRDFTKDKLREMGFEVFDSSTNFLFAKHKSISGEKIFEELKKAKIMIRHFSNPKISDYNRITIGTSEQMQTMLKELKRIIK